MSPGPEFGMDGKLSQPQKMNNKAEGTPKSDSKSKVCSPGNKKYFILMGSKTCHVPFKDEIHHSVLQ